MQNNSLLEKNTHILLKLSPSPPHTCESSANLESPLCNKSSNNKLHYGESSNHAPPLKVQPIRGKETKPGSNQKRDFTMEAQNYYRILYA